MALTDIKLPDIGNFDEVDVIDIAVAVGDTVAKDDSLMTLESDKASMDVPAEMAGVIKEILVKVGDKVKEGDLVFRIEASEAAAPAAPKEAPKVAEKPVDAPKAEAPQAAPVQVPAQPVPAANTANQAALDFSGAHASPSVRAFARELGADLNQVKGSGPKLRIMREDVVAYVKGMMTGAGSVGAVGTTNGGGLSLLPWPKVDFAKFGEITREPMSRIKKISGANLARNWAMIPHVTQFDESDVTELEAFRKQLNKENEKSGKKVTMLAFLVKACVHALKKFPEFNSSLDGDDLILKNYYHIGFAADTPNGLVVPVIRDCDQKSVLEIAAEMGELAKLAREGKLKPDQMQGGCFTISSLGGIGGTAFTPIINAPEVAILGVSRTDMKPVWNGSSFEPRLMLPLSLSYDHRVIDGAAGARFIVHLNQCLTDMRRILV
ncbi:dihydrolipoyllysine-residue acetyltransferase [Wohlfahrtiimonas chitiniclastica]|uniref:Acetyltransferase component of pyruvate dehydrogenase complex n=1 Tax=Wohlfahrtiimonas chitiniclastica TaxID=400946 RepID=A0AB35BXQ4_9GAMM|nr:dihydrolipoyllysine-residue acetyltransferase [Wohlfahrtiimonas chitiniclastica]MBS7823662.1 dihydrolipoyllysine-residue acetyltransferase [Wohlfahrtiimonas chitiniclastica]MBS7839280.1 dihydrolipoyllysine-residue acetyltransferase [Wohlfahrtiimonas chitiniclastica]